MAVNKVDLYVSQILEDLDNGLTWLKRDDVGYGSIQEKYNAKDQQIVMIRKHPSLKDAETNITVFNIIDDLKNERATPLSANGQDTPGSLERIPGTDSRESGSGTQVLPNSNKADGQTLETSDVDSFSAFATL